MTFVQISPPISSLEKSELVCRFEFWDKKLKYEKSPKSHNNGIKIRNDHIERLNVCHNDDVNLKFQFMSKIKFLSHNYGYNFTLSHYYVLVFHSSVILYNFYVIYQSKLFFVCAGYSNTPAILIIPYALWQWFLFYFYLIFSENAV